jgi:hypothetical protein
MKGLMNRENEEDEGDKQIIKQELLSIICE